MPPAGQQYLADHLARLDNWTGLHASFETYTPRCDDGWMAEGYTDAVVKMLADRWATLPELAHLARQDPLFQAFVIRHVDASADPDDLDKIVAAASRECPPDLRELCDSLATAAKRALQERK